MIKQMFDVSHNPRPDNGVFPDPARRWGGGGDAFRLSPAICQSNEPIFDPKTKFYSSGLELPEYVAKFYLNVTDDVTGRAKDQFFNICHCSLRRAKQPY